VAYYRLLAAPSLFPADESGRERGPAGRKQGGREGERARRDQEKYLEDAEEMEEFVKMFMVREGGGREGGREEGKVDYERVEGPH